LRDQAPFGVVQRNVTLWSVNPKLLGRNNAQPKSENVAAAPHMKMTIRKNVESLLKGVPEDITPRK
jgi:hypothetical protein